MSITLVQSAGQTASSTSISHTFSGVTAGDMLLVWFSVSAPTLADVTVSDNNGNLWQIANSIESLGVHNVIGIAYASGVNAGSTAITIANSTSQTVVAGFAEYSTGVVGKTFAVDQIAAATGVGTSLSSGNVTTTSASELLIGVVAPQTGTLTLGSGFTTLPPSGNSIGEYQIVSSTGSYAATGTTSVSGNWTAVLATFLIAPYPIFNTPAGRFNSAGKLVGGLLVPIWTGVNVTPVTVNANSTSDQNLMSYPIPAQTMNSLGRTLNFVAKGVYSTPVSSTATLTVKVELGSATLLTFVTSANAGSVTNNTFLIEGQITTQTAGSSAAFEASGQLTIDLGASTSSACSIFADTNTATVGTVDLTTDETLQVTVAFSAASASNSATQRQLVLQTIF